MRKFDILVPIILIACLIALAYILTQIFSEQDKNTSRAEQAEIVLDPSRYTEEAPSAANISNTPEALSDKESEPATSGRLDDYYEEDQPEENASSQPSYDSDPVPITDYVSEDERQAASSSSNNETTSVSRGKYLVIAGSFRQEIYAKDRIKNLKASGFRDTEMGYTNRGTYAVALVGASDSYSQAKKLAQQVQAKGYEVFIKQRH